MGLPRRQCRLHGGGGVRPSRGLGGGVEPPRAPRNEGPGAGRHPLRGGGLLRGARCRDPSRAGGDALEAGHVPFPGRRRRCTAPVASGLAGERCGVDRTCCVAAGVGSAHARRCSRRRACRERGRRRARRSRAAVASRRPREGDGRTRSAHARRARSSPRQRAVESHRADRGDEADLARVDPPGLGDSRGDRGRRGPRPWHDAQLDERRGDVPGARDGRHRAGSTSFT